MGRSKALLELEGTSFVRRVVGTLRNGGCARVLVVVAAGDQPVVAEAAAAGAEVIENPDPGEGPITSLRLALAALGSPEPSPDIEAIAYLPVDHPLVRADTVALLIEKSRATGARLTVPTRGAKRGHPAIFGRALFAELLDARLEGGARTVVHRHLSDARFVASDDPGVIADIDTPAAYADIAARCRERTR